MMTERVAENDGQDVVALDAKSDSGFEFTEIESRLAPAVDDLSCGCSHCAGCDGCGL